MFEGLDSLERLNLDNNRISYIEPRSFANLFELQILLLKENKLTSLNVNAFQISMNTKLTLSLKGNYFQCDSKLCWIKKGEELGKITWYRRNQNQEEKLICVNYPGDDWDDIALNCTGNQCGLHMLANKHDSFK